MALKKYIELTHFYNLTVSIAEEHLFRILELAEKGASANELAQEAGAALDKIEDRYKIAYKNYGEYSKPVRESYQDWLKAIGEEPCPIEMKKIGLSIVDRSEI